MSQSSNNLAAYSWSLADLLRGDFKQSQYGRIILPFTLLRRLECVLAPTKAKVLAEAEKLKKQKLPEEAQEKFLLRATGGLSFFNTSRMDLSTLGESGIKANLLSYVSAFSKDAREIFEYFNFAEFIGQLNDANLLYKVVQRVRQSDLSPTVVSNHEMGLVFEELIRRFAESSNETAGEHFTPRDIVRLTTSLVFMEDDEALTKPGIIRTIYDPTAGTGGFLSAGMEYVHELNPRAVIRAFGQELNPESYAICKADMLIKGQDVSRIKLGNTLSNDQLYADKFDYMLSNPPFGVDWKKIEGDILKEHTEKGYEGRFGPGLPRVSDGSLLFLLHLLSKLRDVRQTGPEGQDGGARIGIILNGSPLFTGGAGSGESEIRRHILENDLLEAIVALPTDMFYNTGIATYVWLLSNKKAPERRGRVMLINGVNLCGKMRKSLGSKRQEMSETDIKTITRAFGEFAPVEPRPLDKAAETKSNRGRPAAAPKTEPEKTFAAKIFKNHEFGYRRITIERPLRLSWQFSDERLATLRFASGALEAPMRWIYETYGQSWTDDPKEKTYGELDEHETDIRTALKADFPELKEKFVKDVLAASTWREQRAVLLKARQLQAKLGTAQHDDFNGFDEALAATGLKLDASEKKQITAAVSWKNPAAARVVKMLQKTGMPDPFYGRFTETEGKVVEFEADSDLCDFENVALDPGQSVDALNEAHFQKEVLPHVPDAWIDATKRDPKDDQVGLVGYEIPPGSFISSPNIANSKGTTLKLKTAIRANPNGLYLWQNNRIETRSDDPKHDAISISVDETELSVEYFNLFIRSEAGMNWLNHTFNPNGNPRIPLSRLLQSKLQVPPLSEQTLSVQSHATYLSILSRLHDIETSIIENPVKADLELQKYSNANNRFENEFTHLLPHPLAILWIQAKNSQDEQSRCKELVWFYEYLGLYTISVIIGQLSPADAQQTLKIVAKNAEKPAITMGTAYNVIKHVRSKYPNTHPQISELLAPKWEQILEKATSIRNEIHHQGLSSKKTLDACIKKLDELNDSMADYCRDFLTRTSLISPISASYENTPKGAIYTYSVNSLDGLALNPCIIKKIKTSAPLESNHLYIIDDSSSPIATHHKLAPLIKILPVDEESGISAFYFYNKWDKNQGKHMYICPYKCAAPNKFIENPFSA